MYVHFACFPLFGCKISACNSTASAAKYNNYIAQQKNDQKQQSSMLESQWIFVFVAIELDCFLLEISHFQIEIYQLQDTKKAINNDRL